MKLGIWVVVFAVVVHVFLCPVDLFLHDSRPAVKGKRVIVTGASQGVGQSLALEFAEQGASQIVIVARSKERLEAVKAEVEQTQKTRVHVLSLDMSTQAASVQLVQESIQLMGGIDYLVLNHITSSNWGTWFEDAKGTYQEKDFLEHMFKVNLFSYVWTVSAAMEDLTKNQGQIAIVSSLAGHIGTPYTATYSATKHALNGFFHGVRGELSIRKVPAPGITMCVLGPIDTEGAAQAKSKIKMVNWRSPRDAALSIIKGVTARKREIFFPHMELYPMKWLHSLFPSVAEYILTMTMAQE
mmetsp:Transcript_15714/g.30804  ORF Transcript_15714/g.30804 Transcript_15714/m.30804 type:complete len:298 (+) Transcript_15714:30-923(+)|eukprot:CAMPEP_0175124572 /NCGR_PEP_ID=MMETSP0087-20121206/2853_1 /TAXON_ID=136419 /ORGANISM="Unknown Unknown, Strain D1" /LENGTH=297 /DNA_ID=CAMNT_0016406349 /DNA_START=24 /DNA_END=917 /DNA_ORIENTATION=+